MITELDTREVMELSVVPIRWSFKLKGTLPHFFRNSGNKEKKDSVCLRLHDDLYGSPNCFKLEVKKKKAFKNKLQPVSE